jgi:hypothetical protein
MATTRSLKDAAQDPLVKKKAASKKKAEGPARTTCVFKVMAALLVGLIGGLVTSRVFKIRL